MRRVLIGAAAALGAIGAGPAAAFAHPLLGGASPPPGLVSPRSPSAVVLGLSEAAVSRGSSISMIGPSGARVPLGALRSSSGARTLSAEVPRRLASAVYTVRWTALGADGHTVSGSFAFGVAGPHGRAPAGAGALGGSGVGGTGSEHAGLEGTGRIAVRWLGLLAASLLLGGVALALLARRREREAGESLLGIWTRAAPFALATLFVASGAGALLVAAGGAGAGLDASLLTVSPTGRVALVRWALVVAASALALAHRSPLARGRAVALGAAGALASYGFEGHVLALRSGRAFATTAQVVHVLSAGVWLGGLLLLALAARAAPGGARAGARTFAPLAASALAVSALTGVLAALREVDHWYFLRFSDYGRVLLVKAALVALVAVAGGATALSFRRGAPRGWLVRGEAAMLVAVVALAAVLGGLAQGRGQAMPAQRGALLPGPAFASALLPSGAARVTLAPARAGQNVISVSQSGAKSGRVRLTCACAARPVEARSEERRVGKEGRSRWGAEDEEK